MVNIMKYKAGDKVKIISKSRGRPLIRVAYYHPGNIYEIGHIDMDAQGVLFYNIKGDHYDECDLIAVDNGSFQLSLF